MPYVLKSLRGIDSRVGTLATILLSWQQWLLLGRQKTHQPLGLTDVAGGRGWLPGAAADVSSADWLSSGFDKVPTASPR